MAALIALVIAVSGSRLSPAAALWLLVPPLVGLAVVLASSWRSPSLPEVARVLDRDLALDERLGTAVEISDAGVAVDGLAALVLAQADTALVASQLSGARPAHRSARREWIGIAGAVVIIAILLVLISGRGEPLGPGGPAAVSSTGHPAGPTSIASGSGANHPRHITGRTRSVGSTGTRATSPSLKTSGRSPALSVVTPPHNSTTAGKLPLGGGNQRTPPGSLGRSGSQTAGLGARAGTRGAGSESSRAGSGSSGQASTHSDGLSRGGRPGSSRGAPGPGRTANPQRIGAGSRAGTFNSNPTSNTRGSTKAPTSSGNNPTQSTGNTRIPSARSGTQTTRSPNGHAHSVGSGAGAGSGGNAVGRPQTKGLPSGLGTRLPIQAGYTPARDRSGPKTGSPAGRTGGKGPARSASENGGGRATAVTFPYIPPSADIGPTDNALLQHYFRSASTVAGRW